MHLSMVTECAVVDALTPDNALPALSLFTVTVLYLKIAWDVRRALRCNQTGDPPEYVYTGVQYLVATKHLVKHSMQVK